jgi:hypothetical protein
MWEVNPITIRILSDLYQSNIETEKIWWGVADKDWYVPISAGDVETKTRWSCGSFEGHNIGDVERRCQA